MALQSHQQRVVDERTELEDRLGKLQDFIIGESLPAYPTPSKGDWFCNTTS